MARVTYVKKAQQRYATVPVLDENGQPKRVPVTGRNGEQKTNKHGRPTFRTVTQDDKSRPLPLRTCDYCHKPIEIGMPYKHISPRSGPYGGRTLTRHGDCPTWHVWEYSSSLSARLAEIAHNFNAEISSIDSVEEVQEALDNAANSVREIAEEKREGAQNIEDGFGHPTSMSDELNEIADSLESWADEIESYDIPEYPEPEEGDCEDCDGVGTTGDGEDEEDCETCSGTGQVTPDEPTEEQMDNWRDEVQQISIVDESPV